MREPSAACAWARPSHRPRRAPEAPTSRPSTCCSATDVCCLRSRQRFGLVLQATNMRHGAQDLQGRPLGEDKVLEGAEFVRVIHRDQ